MSKGKEKKKGNEKVFLLIISLIVIISSISFFIFFWPKIKDKQELAKLEQEITLLDDYLKNKVEIKEVKDYVKKDVTSEKRKELEKKIDAKVEKILEDDVFITSINDKRISKALTKDKLKDFMYSEDLGTFYLETQSSLKKGIELATVSDEINDDLYQRMIKKIDLKTYSENMKWLNGYIDSINQVYNFISSNKENYNIDEKLILIKRSSFNEFDEIMKKIDNRFSFDIIDYELIEDKEPPVIYASDFSLIKGNDGFGFNCIDEVDGAVKCNISGNYDINTVGSYDITITAKDESGNESSKTVKMTVKEQKVYKNPYYVEIIRNHNVVVVYGLDGNNEYTRIVKVFICSVGMNNWTPTGTFTTSKGYEWGTLNGGLYGQYSTRIKGSILFHSVPYYSMSKDQLEWEEFNKLGEAASQGCIRMTVADVKWIFDNCPSGMTVKIYDGDLPSGVTKPTAPKIDGTSPNRGWDPTDPDPNNPWKNS